MGRIRGGTTEVVLCVLDRYRENVTVVGRMIIFTEDELPAGGLA